MGIKVKEYKIINNNIGNFYGLKIVHVTDLHYGMTNEKKLKKLVKEINLTKPDIVLFTGDLVDKNTEYSPMILGLPSLFSCDLIYYDELLSMETVKLIVDEIKKEKDISFSPFLFVLSGGFYKFPP